VCGKEEKRMVWISYTLFTASFSCRFLPVLSPVSSFCRYQLLWFTLSPQAQPFLTLFPFHLFFLLSFYLLLRLLIPFFNYTLLSISFSFFFFLSFFFSIPFLSYVYSRKTYTLSIQPFNLDPTDWQDPGWIW